MARITMRLALAASLVLCFGLYTMAGSDEKSTKADEKARGGDELKVTAKKEKGPAAPNFSAFGFPFESTETLGPRLALARQKNDPIALSLLATEIGMNEKVSGKKADVTGADIAKEAVELVKQRNNSRELMAVALLVKEEDSARELTTLAEKARKQEALSGTEKTRGFHYLKVTNNTDVWARISANGHHLGAVAPNSTQTFHTPFMKHHHHIHLRAHDNMGDVWRTNAVTGDHLTYHWNLYP